MLEKFTFQNFQVRVIVLDSIIYFVALDLAIALDYSGTGKMLQLVDDQDKREINPQKLEDAEIARSFGENTFKVVIITESGMYDCIFGSTKPEAKIFKRWVTTEVLPSIRKTGSYSIIKPKTKLELAEENLRLSQEYVEALRQIEKQEKDLAIQKLCLQVKEEVIQKQDEVLTEQNLIIAEQEPKVQFYQAFREVETNVTVEIFAKTISNKLGGRFPAIGRNNLFKILRKYQFVRTAPYNPPFQRYVDSGMFAIIQKTNTNLNQAYTQTLVTPKGQQYLLGWFLKKYQTPEDLRLDLR